MTLNKNDLSTITYKGPGDEPTTTAITYRTIVRPNGKDEVLAQFETLVPIPYAVGHEWRFGLAPTPGKPVEGDDAVGMARWNDIYVIRSIQHGILAQRTNTTTAFSANVTTFLDVERVR